MYSDREIKYRIKKNILIKHRHNFDSNFGRVSLSVQE